MNLASYIDHTLLKADATLSQIEKLCEEAKQYQFASVCINPNYVKEASSLLDGTDVKVCTVIGFPLGATTTEVKALETKNAIENGADEIDMVINIGALKDHRDQIVKQDIQAVVKAAEGKTVKVIIETALLDDEQKKRACILSLEAKAHFVKTSTGFSTGGANKADISLMRETVGDQMKIKASGGIRDLETAKSMISAGADRLGASSGVSLMQGKTSNNSY